jgi:hypothetical protein
MNVWRRCLLPIIVLLSAVQSSAWGNDEIAILVPAFSDHDLGVNVGTAFNVEIWKTTSSSARQKRSRCRSVLEYGDIIGFFIRIGGGER